MSVPSRHAENQTRLTRYDADNRVAEVSYHNARLATPTVSFKYDAVHGRMTEMKDGSGVTTYGYGGSHKGQAFYAENPTSYRYNGFDPRYDKLGNPVPGAPTLRSADGPPNGWYVSFDRATGSAMAKDMCQLPDKSTARFMLEFETSVVKEKIRLPYARQEELPYFEPRARSYPENGLGEATQALVQDCDLPLKAIYEDVNGVYVKIWGY